MIKFHRESDSPADIQQDFADSTFVPAAIKVVLKEDTEFTDV